MPDKTAPAPQPQETLSFAVVAHIRTAFSTKFGVPRQSGLVPETRAEIVFTPPYRVPEAVRGLEGFSHLWLIWHFSAVRRQPGEWSPTVRPPRLGGNTRVGVFATRSPYRPDPIGLSSVRLLDVRPHAPDGPVLTVAGADLMDGTPILDIKPYLPYTDSHPDATGGFADAASPRTVTVDCPPALLLALPAQTQAELLAVLRHDPRPAYQHDSGRVYGMTFAGYEVRFSVDGDRLTVLSID